VATLAIHRAAARDLADQVQVDASDYVITTGGLLNDARELLGQEAYERWVVESLPFGLDTARRYRAVYLAVTNLPDAPLPAPHRALYAVGHGDMPEEVVPPERPVEETAADLLRHDPSELSARLRVLLEVWLVSDHQKGS
jgi:hypothetical protein